MQTRYIEIQNQIISDVIRPILTDVGMLIGNTETIKIRFPSRELYCQIVPTAPKADTRSDWRLLMAYWLLTLDACVPWISKLQRTHASPNIIGTDAHKYVGGD